MPKQPIKCPVVTLDTSNQLGLFALEGGSGVTDKPLGRTQGVEFKDPDPRSILLNDVRLDEHLQRQGMVEPVFSLLKCRQGLRRFRREGLKSVRCEFALHAMACNLSRAVALCARDIFFVFCWLLLVFMSSAREGKAQLL